MTVPLACQAIADVSPVLQPGSAVLTADQRGSQQQRGLGSLVEDLHYPQIHLHCKHHGQLLCPTPGWYLSSQCW